jgi:dihydrofolate synthase/folylpolyglutamate synthase
MNFREAEAYLFSLGNEVAAMKLGLENTTRLLAALGNPEKKYLKVQVAGTNGKGSVCAFLKSICLEAGIKAGVYTSPHLISITERINIGGVDIGEDEFARLASVVRETSEQLADAGEIDGIPTFFEQITAIALLAFADANVELAILETGLGGRLDATTAANAEIAAITRIDYDHQEYLGETLADIAAEKAAIIRLGSRVVVGKQEPEVLPVILGRCKDLEVIPLTVCEPSVWATDLSKHSAVVEFRTNRGAYWDSSLGIAGRHQIENACTAILVAETLALDFGLPISEENVWAGLEDARHPGRLEFIDRFLLDGAHNVGGAEALREFLNEFVDKPITLVFGVMNDKNVHGMAEILFPKADEVILTMADNSRAMPMAQLRQQLPLSFDQSKITFTNSTEEALKKADEVSADGDVILVTGSLYLVGEARQLLTGGSV